MTSSTSTSSHLESPIPQLIQNLEENAAEMASLLDSLVQHFDLCVNAIKHTEGGFAAVKKAATDNQLPDGVTVSGVIEETGKDSDLERISDEDRKQMLTVLSNDAAEVEDVVLELHQRLQSMEEQHEQIQEHLRTLTAAYTSTVAAFTILETIGSRLHAYIASSQDFLLRWTDSKAQIEEQMEELESIRIFYEGYMTSYHGLIEEVARRKAAEEKMKAILKKAMEQVKKLHDADTREREAFRRDMGEFLPSDLWPGLVANSPRFEIMVVGEETYGDDDVEGKTEPAEPEPAARG
jgi:autophagy-related protein 17